MKQIRISKEMSKYLSNKKQVIENENRVPRNEDVLKLFGLENETGIEANDYFQFFKYFGNDIEIYKKLKPLKDEAEVSWRDIKNLKWGDIDLENNTVRFEQEIKKRKNKERNLDI